MLEPAAVVVGAAAVVVGAGVVVVGAASPELVAEDRAEVSALFVVPPPHADRNSKQQTTPTANFMHLSVHEIHPKAEHSWFSIFQTLKATNPLCCYGRPMSEIRVEAIHIHPVKSCRRIEVDEASILSTGLAHDREWQIVDPRAVASLKERILRWLPLRPLLMATKSFCQHLVAGRSR